MTQMGIYLAYVLGSLKMVSLIMIIFGDYPLGISRYHDIINICLILYLIQSIFFKLLLSSLSILSSCWGVVA